MRRALIVGGGSENGKPIIECLLDNDFFVLNLGSSIYQHHNVVNLHINWHDLDIENIHRKFSMPSDHYFDFVFFNHNSSSLRLNDFSIDHDDTLDKWRRLKDWSHSHWLSCQMPFLIIHTIRKSIKSTTKIGWMLSDYIDHNQQGSVDFADYSSYKFFNYLAMKSFAKINNFQTFGIFPNFSNANSHASLQQVLQHIIDTDHLQSDEFRI